MVLDLKNITANEYSGALPMSDAEFVDHLRPNVFQAVSLNVTSLMSPGILVEFLRINVYPKTCTERLKDWEYMYIRIWL